MHNTNITNSDSFPDEVQINLNVFSVLMLDRVGEHVDCANVVTVDQRGTAQGSMELL